LVAEGVDPREHRRQLQAAAAVQAAKLVTFEQMAERFIASHEAGWRNPKHRQQWRNTLRTYVYPVIGELPVQEIDTALAMKILEPLWRTKLETASRVRGRCEAIWDAAKAQKLCSGENPFDWKTLGHLLPAKTKIHKVAHHAAVPYRELPPLMADLRARTSVSARALEFTILTAARSNEVIAAQWSEFDFDRTIWTVPPHKMKGGREHVVPLPKRAVEILLELRGDTPPQPDALVWGLSAAALSKMLSLLGRTETVHGCRSSFKDWASECTNFRDAVSEAALAHVSADKVKAAYERTTFEQQRRELMEAWSRFLASPPIDTANNIVSLRTA
jgi:integrase